VVCRRVWCVWWSAVERCVLVVMVQTMVMIYNERNAKWGGGWCVGRSAGQVLAGKRLREARRKEVAACEPPPACPLPAKSHNPSEYPNDEGSRGNMSSKVDTPGMMMLPSCRRYQLQRVVVWMWCVKGWGKNGVVKAGGCCV